MSYLASYYRLFCSKYFGVSKLYLKISIHDWAITIVKENPKTIHHFLSPVLSFKMNDNIIENKKPKVAPKVMKIWWQLVNVPEISFGESYFIIIGAIELNKPVQKPW